jgi:hypothetical protein
MGGCTYRTGQDLYNTVQLLTSMKLGIWTPAIICTEAEFTNKSSRPEIQ